MGTVIKHSYLKHARGCRLAVAHINYIQHRSGADRKHGPRQFFNKEATTIPGTHIKNRVDTQNKRGVILHKLVVSPGLKSTNIRAFVTDLMENLARAKGQELEWYAVEHRNTANPHAHVVIMGTAPDTTKVTLYLTETRELRSWGDKYLEREHIRELCLDKERRRLNEQHLRDRTDDLAHRKAGLTDWAHPYPIDSKESDFWALDSLIDGTARERPLSRRITDSPKQKQLPAKPKTTPPLKQPKPKDKEPERER